jgi:hypothetical protein
MKLYDTWCKGTPIKGGRKIYLELAEKTGGRKAVRKRLGAIVRDHYGKAEHIADDVAALGFEGAAEILREVMPAGKRMRSGDLGEILATELTEEMLGFEVPVRRLRYKDGREMALRGDDFIGVRLNDNNDLHLMKGESKSRAKLSKATIQSARLALNSRHGRCTPSSLMFIANLLLEGTAAQKKIGRKIREEIGKKALARDRIDHTLFTMSANGAPAALKDDHDSADGARGQAVINLQIADHQAFIKEIYEEALDLGDD